MRYTGAGILMLGIALNVGCATKHAPVPMAAPVAIEPAPQAAVVMVKPAVMPRVMLLVDEKSLGTIPTAEVEAMAIATLLELGASVADQDMVRANIAKDQQLLKMAGDNRGAAALGLQYGADVIIIGEAVAKPSARRIAESNLRAYQAVVTLRAVRTDSSATIASSSEDSSIVGLDDVGGSSKALKAAGRKSLDVLLPIMFKALAVSGGTAATAGGGQTAEAKANTSRVELTVGGVDQVWKLKAVRERFRGMTGKVLNVTQRSYTLGVAIFEVDSVMPAEELAEELVMNPPAGLKFQVVQVSQGKIDLKAADSQ